MIEIIKSVFNCTKKVVEFLDTHKVEIVKGVLSLMTITFADGKINVSIDGSPKTPEVRNTYTDITPTTATAAIDAFAATANEMSWDTDKLGCAYKIVTVIKNTPNVSDSTKQHAIKALGAIKNSMTWSSDKQRCDDYIMAIINL